MVPNRCDWCKEDPLNIAYHDEEWGVFEKEDRKLFEQLTLEGAQAGLNWLTILRKAEGYRQAFDHFEIARIADYDDTKIASLLQDTRIVRHRLKILSTRNNARCFLKIQKEFGSFYTYQSQFINHRPIVNNWENTTQIPTSTPLSDAFSKALKKRGFTFVGTTILYAYMQAVGMVNDHLVTCYRHQELQGRR